MPSTASPLGFFLARRRRLAVGYTLTIPAMTPVGHAGTLSVTPSPTGAVLMGTISLAVANGGASPATLTFNGSATQTVAITPAATGLVTISPTNDSAYPDPSPATTTGYTPIPATAGGGGGGLSLAPGTISFVFDPSPSSSPSPLLTLSGGGNILLSGGGILLLS